MKEIVVISGKGGTGKTSLVSALAFINPERVVLADCDVDAADLHLILQPRTLCEEDFISGVKAEISADICISCGTCSKVCRFAAINSIDSLYNVDHFNCEGCGYCYHVCPTKAISLIPQHVGQCFISDTKISCQLVHAKLSIGAENSGKLVAKVKKDARAVAVSKNKDIVLVDGSPGIGCPVISSLSGADFALIVTEPTLSGFSDLQRVWQLAVKFKIPTGCIINKTDINPQIAGLIKQFLAQNSIWLVDELPYDDDFSKAITIGQSLIEYNPQKWQTRLTSIWDKITN